MSTPLKSPALPPALPEFFPRTAREANTAAREIRELLDSVRKCLGVPDGEQVTVYASKMRKHVEACKCGAR